MKIQRIHPLVKTPTERAARGLALIAVGALQITALITGSMDARAWQYEMLKSGFEASEVTAGEDYLCSGIPEAVALGVQPPAPPGPVDVPGDACVADTTSLLQQHVNNPACLDILLSPGEYEATGLEFDYKFLRFKRKTRLWASQPGKVILRFGISLGAQLDHPNEFDGSALHGLVIDILDPAYSVPENASTSTAVLFWGKTSNVSIRDTVIRGHGRIHRGISAIQPNGMDIRRVEIDGFLRFGLVIHWAEYVSRAHVEDISVRRVGDPQWWHSGNYFPGTQEIGIWLGFPTTLTRARTRDTYWSGMAPAAHNWNNKDVRVNDLILSDIDIDRVGDDKFRGAGVAFYVERVTHDMDLNRFCIGNKTQRGVNVEWNHFFPYQSARNLTIGHGVISSKGAGVLIDYGALDTHLHNLHIRNANWTGVGMIHNYVAEECNLNPNLNPDPTPEVCGVENPDFCVVEPDADCGQPLGVQATPRLCPQLCNTTTWDNITFDLPEGDDLPCQFTFNHLNDPVTVCLNP